MFLCLFESFWKRFESERRRLTLQLSNILPFRKYDAPIMSQVSSIINSSFYNHFNGREGEFIALTLLHGRLKLKPEILPQREFNFS